MEVIGWGEDPEDKIRTGLDVYGTASDDSGGGSDVEPSENSDDQLELDDIPLQLTAEWYQGWMLRGSCG